MEITRKSNTERERMLKSLRVGKNKKNNIMTQEELIYFLNFDIKKQNNVDTLKNIAKAWSETKDLLIKAKDI